MTSQLNVDTIVDKAGSGGTNVKIGNTSTYVSDGGAVTQNTVQGLCKVWHNSQNDASANDNFNVSGSTDNGTGDYSYTFTNSFANAHPAISGICAEDDRNAQFVRSRSTSEYRIRHYGHDDAYADVANAGQLHGDLA